jgi:hypothetical protein
VKKYKLKFKADHGTALINCIDTVLNVEAANKAEKLVMAGLLEVKQKLVGKMFGGQMEYKMSLTHVQALALHLLPEMIDLVPTTQIGGFLLNTSNEIAQKYSI